MSLISSHRISSNLNGVTQGSSLSNSYFKNFSNTNKKFPQSRNFCQISKCFRVLIGKLKHFQSDLMYSSVTVRTKSTVSQFLIACNSAVITLQLKIACD